MDPRLRGDDKHGGTLIIYSSFVSLRLHGICTITLREEFPRVAPDQPLTEALAGFLGIVAERLPVVERDGTLRGSLSKSDLLLALIEKQKKPAEARG